MVGCDHLDAIWQVVSAKLSLFEEVDDVWLLANLEGPFAIDVLAQAVDRLVSLDSHIINE